MSDWDTSNLLSEEGDFERLHPYTSWYVPRDIRLDGPLLVWKWNVDPFDNSNFIERRPSPGLLAGFLKLSEGSDEETLQFARRWGVLGICKHALPRTHHPAGYPPSDETAGCGHIDYDRDHCVEPLQSWRHFANQMRSALNVAARLIEDEVGKPNDWQIIYGRALANTQSPRQAPWWKQSVETDRVILARVIDELIRLSGVRPAYEWATPTPRFQVFQGSLFGALVVQLASVVSGAKGIANCTVCTRFYVPKRKPRTGENHYCEPCRRRGEPQRLASQRHRDGRTKIRTRARPRGRPARHDRR